MLYGAIEAGGTKFRSAIYQDEKIIDELTVATTTPEVTLKPIIAFFSNYKIKALGLGAFGPVILNRESPDFGLITQTPKEKWRNFNIYRYFVEKLNVPICLDTDVGVAALGEYYAYRSRVNHLLYVTVGTGIGVGVIKNGIILRGAHHPELGHLLIARRGDDKYPSVCPYHDNCIEGLASGSSLTARYHLSPSQLADREDIWDLEGYYLAQAFLGYTLAFAPERIVIGGGVSAQARLLPNIRKHFTKLNNGYYIYPQLSNPDLYITLPLTGNNAGIYGAYCLVRGEG
ncbi:MAG: ROK family protein [Bacilli bacterium]|nr:ROK family protein [Bacilli bacterium]MDD4388036.1 ROK family protein [Bacilli bacterium]